MADVKQNVAGWIAHYIYGTTPAQKAAIPQPPDDFRSLELQFDRMFVRDRSKYLAGPGIIQP